MNRRTFLATGAIAFFSACGGPERSTPTPAFKPAAKSGDGLFKGVPDPIKKPDTLPTPVPIREGDINLITREKVQFGPRSMVINHDLNVFISADPGMLENIISNAESHFKFQSSSQQPYVFTILPNTEKEVIDAHTQSLEAMRALTHADHTEKKLAERFPQAAAARNYFTIFITVNDILVKTTQRLSMLPQATPAQVRATLNLTLNERLFGGIAVTMAKDLTAEERNRWISSKVQEYQNNPPIAIVGLLRTPQVNPQAPKPKV